jgi:hypothetical protein
VVQRNSRISELVQALDEEKATNEDLRETIQLRDVYVNQLEADLQVGRQGEGDSMMGMAPLKRSVPPIPARLHSLEPADLIHFPSQ